MRKIKLLGTALAVTASVLAAGVSSASATLPEFGQCTKAATPKTGEYMGSSCVRKSATNKGSYNWTPGPPAKKKFSGVGEAVELVTTSGRTITCGAAIYSGEYTGAKTETLTIDLVGCTDSGTGKSCQSNPINEGEIESYAPLSGELGMIKMGERLLAGLDLKPTSPSPYLFAFECGSFPTSEVHETIEGSVIGPIVPQNTATEEFKILYRARHGIQTVQEFDGGPKDTLVTNFTEGITTKSEVTALKGTFFNTNEEAFEIKSKTL